MTILESAMQKPANPHYNSRTADKFVIRLPDGMREKLKDAAKGNKRSLNSEMISRLEASLNPQPFTEQVFVEADEPRGWMPAMGVAAWYRGDSKLYVIMGLEVRGGNELYAKLENLEDWVPVKHLHPYYV